MSGWWSDCAANLTSPGWELCLNWEELPTAARLYFPDDKRNMLLSIFGLSAYNRILFSITISTIGIIYLFVIDLKSCLIVNENLYLRKFILVRGYGYSTINQTLGCTFFERTWKNCPRPEHWLSHCHNLKVGWSQQVGGGRLDSGDDRDTAPSIPGVNISPGDPGLSEE